MKEKRKSPSRNMTLTRPLDPARRARVLYKVNEKMVMSYKSRQPHGMAMSDRSSGFSQKSPTRTARETYELLWARSVRMSHEGPREGTLTATGRAPHDTR